MIVIAMCKRWADHNFSSLKGTEGIGGAWKAVVKGVFGRKSENAIPTNSMSFSRTGSRTEDLRLVHNIVLAWYK
jgi:hypothetical protein